MSGHDLDKAARILAKFAPLLEPDLVLVGVTWNDLPYEDTTPDGSLPQSTRITRLRPRPGDRFRLVGGHSRVNLLLRRSRFVYALSRLRLQLKYALGWQDHQLLWEEALLRGQESPAIEQAWKTLQSSLETLQDTADSHGLNTAILVMPFRNQLRDPYPRARFQTQLRIIAQHLNLPIIDPLPQFRARVAAIDDLFIPFDRIHPGPHGYQLLAEAAFQFLLRDGGLGLPPPSPDTAADPPQLQLLSPGQPAP